MIFASFEFLCLFLPVFLAVYYLTPPRLRNWPILLFSYAFYAWWRVDFLVLLAGVTLFTYAVARCMADAPRRRPQWLVIGLAGNLGALGYFKYSNLGVATLNGALAAGDLSPLAWTEIVLPAGLSFYVLQSISYLVDVARGVVPASRSLLDYAAYKALFAQLIAGPIVRYAQVAGELRGRGHSLVQFGRGARRFMVGLAMKVIVADTLAPLVDAAFALPSPTLADAWLGAVAFTLQLYFDFAGYSAMAIGLALMIGFHFPENFADPYLAGSIQAFWQRWHMTLSSFLRDYLYIPLGGNRAGPARTTANLMLTMLIGGLWHGANWTFVAWGGLHGALLAAHRAWRVRGGDMPWLAGHILTLLAVILAWVLFRADSFVSASSLYAGMAGFHGAGISDDLAWQLTPDRLWMAGIGVAIVYLPLVPRPAGSGVAMGLAFAGPFCGFLLAIVLLYSRAAVPFLYFQF